MSTRYNGGSHYENHQRATEIEDGAAHAHQVGEHQGKQEHLTGHEHSRHDLEHPGQDREQAHAPTVGHGVASFGHDDVAALAHQLWEARGCPDGSPQEDWFHAAEKLRSRSYSR